MAGAEARNSGPRRIVFLGPPSSGKGTQAGLLAERLGVPAISTGDMLRQAVETGSELGRRVRGVMERGELVSDELMADVVRERLSRRDAREGYVLDGYPRTGVQARHLEEILEERGQELDDVLLIDAPEQVLVERALGRGRSDDKEEVVLERLRQYREKTAPLVELYERQGKLERIDGDRTVEEVSREIRDTLGVEYVE